MRVVSLLASATEIICALGCRDYLVGRSHECDFPEDIDALPVCSRVCIDATGAAEEIDAIVRERLQAKLPLYEIDWNILCELRPDCIVTQHQCDVCAVGDEQFAKCPPELCGVTYVSLGATSLETWWNDVRNISRALNVAAAGEKLIRQLQRDFLEITQGGDLRCENKRILFLEWTAPLMACGNWIPEIIELGGGVPLLGRPHAHASIVRPEEIASADPDVIIIGPCGFQLDRSVREAKMLTGKSWFQNLRATRQGRIFAVDGNALFNRSGPRLLDSAKTIRDILCAINMKSSFKNGSWINI